MFFSDAGDQNKTPLQFSDSRKKISFRWNSRTFPTGSLVVSSKSAEQLMTESANNNKLVPYEDDITDDSETEREAAETTKVMCVTTEEKTNVDDAGCADSCENTCSITAVSLPNGKSDDINTSNAEQLLNRAESSVTSVADSNESLSSSGVNNGHASILCEVADSNESLSSSGVNNGDASILCEVLSNSVSVSDVESRRAQNAVAPTEDCLAALVNGGSSNKTSADDSSVYQPQNGALSSDNNTVRHAVAARKRHARHKSRRHHVKRRHRHRYNSASDSSDEEVEYVWVEKTAETIAQQLIGKCHLLLIVATVTCEDQFSTFTYVYYYGNYW